MEKKISYITHWFTRILCFLSIFGHIILICVCLIIIKKTDFINQPLPHWARNIDFRVQTTIPEFYDFINPITSYLVSLEKTDLTAGATPEILNKYAKGAHTSWRTKSSSKQTIYVDSSSSLKDALLTAAPSTKIILNKGTYTISEHSLPLGNSGSKKAPIIVQGKRLGDAVIQLKGEGFLVNKPHWQFHNLVIEGNCLNDDKCEHAFHVVGQGQYVRIENNIIRNFNAMIKINGFDNHYPDHGHIANNTIYNERPRNTANPVTPIDLMHANHWHVADNFIYDFVKGAGNKISYGAFFKGGSKGGVFERNLVACQVRLNTINPSIGLSLGGGGSPAAWRRNLAAYENAEGVIANNIIVNCPNAIGIYLNRAREAQVVNNTIVNTKGIDVRYSESSANIAYNVVDGRIKERDKGQSSLRANRILSYNWIDASLGSFELYKEPLKGDFSLLESNSLNIPKIRKNNSLDFCGLLSKTEYIGALSQPQMCKKNLKHSLQGNIDAQNN